jgi:hypothetical protein
MKKIIVITVTILLGFAFQSQSQDSRSLRAARASFNAAENNYKKDNFQQAARDYEIVINTIPEDIDSRRYLEIRLESLIKLIDINFHRHISLNQACEYLQMYYSNINAIRFEGVLRSSDLLNYQRIEKDFEAQHSSKCQSFRNLDRDMDEFKKKFEEEFE